MGVCSRFSSLKCQLSPPPNPQGGHPLWIRRRRRLTFQTTGSIISEPFFITKYEIISYFLVPILQHGARFTKPSLTGSDRVYISFLNNRLFLILACIMLALNINHTCSKHTQDRVTGQSLFKATKSKGQNKCQNIERESQRGCSKINVKIKNGKFNLLHNIFNSLPANGVNINNI